jgi:hypothetical protein
MIPYPFSTPELAPEVVVRGKSANCPTCKYNAECKKRIAAHVFVRCEIPVYQDVIAAALAVESDQEVIRKLERSPQKLAVLEGFHGVVVGEQFIKPEFLGNAAYELGWTIGKKAITQ